MSDILTSCAKRLRIVTPTEITSYLLAISGFTPRVSLNLNNSRATRLRFTSTFGHNDSPFIYSRLKSAAPMSFIAQKLFHKNLLEQIKSRGHYKLRNRLVGIS